MKNFLKKIFRLGSKAENVTALSEEERNQLTEQFAQKHNTPLFLGSIQHVFSQQRIKDTSTCPNCEAPTEKKTALYACATNSITQFIISNDGYFCTNCRTVIIDDKALQNACEKGKVYRGVLGLAKGERIETYESLNEYIIRYSYDQKGRPNAMKITNQKVEIHSATSVKDTFKEKVKDKIGSENHQQSKEHFKHKTKQSREDFKTKHSEKRTFKPKTNQESTVEETQQTEEKTSPRQRAKKNYRTKHKTTPKDNTEKTDETTTQQSVKAENQPNDTQEPGVEVPKEKSSRLARLKQNQNKSKPSSRRPRRNVRPPIDLDLKPTTRIQRRRPNNTKNK